jgi:hypothetical protein
VHGAASLDRQLERTMKERTRIMMTAVCSWGRSDESELRYEAAVTTMGSCSALEHHFAHLIMLDKADRTRLAFSLSHILSGFLRLVLSKTRAV